MDFHNETSVKVLDRALDHIDLISTILVVFVVFVCLVVCCLVGKNRRSHFEEPETEEIGADSDPYSSSLNHQHSNMVEGVDKSILRGSPSTPESPPPSYYTTDRGNSFQSYVSGTSSQFEVPPAYEGGRISLNSTTIPEEVFMCEGVPEITEGRSGVGTHEVGVDVGKIGRNCSRRTRLSEPAAGFVKNRKKRRTKSDIIKDKKKGDKKTSALDPKTNEGGGVVSLLRGLEGKEGGGIRNGVEGGADGDGSVSENENVIISMPRRFSKKESIISSHFTPV